jgi:hypothetical protein
VYLVKVPVRRAACYSGRQSCATIPVPCGGYGDSSACDILCTLPCASQEIFAELVRGRSDVADALVAEFAQPAAPASGAAAGKRKRLQLDVTVNKRRAIEVLGADVVDRTPMKFKVTLDDPAGTRVLGFSEAAGVYTFLGKPASHGAMVPDMADPAYSKYTAWRRSQDQSNAAQRRSTALADNFETFGAQRRAASAAAESAAAVAVTGAGGRAAGGAGAASASTKRFPSVLAAFEDSPYWSSRQLGDATGKPDADVSSELRRVATYVQAGERRGTWFLKSEYRSARTAAPDAEHA